MLLEPMLVYVVLSFPAVLLSQMVIEQQQSKYLADGEPPDTPWAVIQTLSEPVCPIADLFQIHCEEFKKCKL